MKEPVPGMNKKKSKAESLFLKEKEWYEEAEEETRPQRGYYSVHTDYPYFGQTPQALLRDPTIRPGPKALYADLHTYRGDKNLKNRPTRFVTQTVLARDLGVHRNSIYRWMKKLEEKGWVTVIQGGWNRPNKIILHGRKKRKRRCTSNRG